MSLFCLLFIPLLYLLRRSPGEGHSLWALPLGAVAVAIQYIVGPLVTPGEFGFARWVSGFVDIVGLPALFPFAVCGIFVLLRVFPREVDYAGFALLWLAPLAAVRSISETPTVVSLIVVPLLWGAQAVGIPFFINSIIRNERRYKVFFASLGLEALPVAAATSWWAFFAQRTLWGALLLAISFVPAVISLLTSVRQKATASERGDTKYIEILNF